MRPGFKYLRRIMSEVKAGNRTGSRLTEAKTAKKLQPNVKRLQLLYRCMPDIWKLRT